MLLNTHPTVHRIAPVTKNDPASDINSVTRNWETPLCPPHKWEWLRCGQEDWMSLHMLRGFACVSPSSWTAIPILFPLLSQLMCTTAGKLICLPLSLCLYLVSPRADLRQGFGERNLCGRWSQDTPAGEWDRETKPEVGATKGQFVSSYYSEELRLHLQGGG